MVLVCKYCGKRGGVEGRTLHKFPLRDLETLKLWLNEINLGSNFIPTNSSRLCSEHFREECFDKKDTRVMLHPGSIPSLFSKCKSSCAYCNATKGENKHLSFRKFPLENPTLLERWLKALNLQDYIPDKQSVICSNHFHENCFYTVGNTGYLRLKSNAVPSLLKYSEAAQLNNNIKKRPSLEPLPATKHLKSSSYLTTPVHVTKESADMENPESAPSQTSETMETCDSSNHLFNENSILNEDPEIPVPLVEQVTGTTLQCKDTPEPPNTGTRKKLLQHDHSYETSPRSVKRRLFSTQQKLKLVTKRAKVQKQHIGRLKRKIRTLKDIVSELRRTRAITESGLACLDAIADSDVSQLLQRFIKNKQNVGNQVQSVKKRAWKSQRSNPGLGISREKYPPALRSFAMTLHFYSPRAYGFVRTKFCHALPDPSTLRSWYSSISGEPGFTSESFDALKLKVDEAKKKQQESDL